MSTRGAKLLLAMSSLMDTLDEWRERLALRRQILGAVENEHNLRAAEEAIRSCILDVSRLQDVARSPVGVERTEDPPAVEVPRVRGTRADRPKGGRGKKEG